MANPPPKRGSYSSRWFPPDPLGIIDKLPKPPGLGPVSPSQEFADEMLTTISDFADVDRTLFELVLKMDKLDKLAAQNSDYQVDPSRSPRSVFTSLRTELVAGQATIRDVDKKLAAARRYFTNTGQSR
jgi:hypothetical protein